MAGCADQVKRVTLELGGKSANIVFADADVELAAARAPYGVFDNAGQDCCARSRILVERPAYDRFLELLEPAVRGVRVGDPTDEASEMGPLISEAHRRSVAAFVPEGAPVAFQGTAPDGPGYWYPPTVLAPVGPDDPAVTEEIFGPVVVVVPFEDEADAVRIANDTRLRALGLDLDPRRGQGPAGGPGSRDRQPVGELALLGPLLDALRRLQAVGDRPGARARRPRRLHRREERVHLDRVTVPTRPRDGGQRPAKRGRDG